MDFANDAAAIRMLDIVTACLRRHTTEELAVGALNELLPLLQDAATRNAFRLTAMHLARRYQRHEALKILTWPLTGSFEQSGAELSEIGDTMRRAVTTAIAEAARKMLVADAAAITALAADALTEPAW